MSKRPHMRLLSPPEESDPEIEDTNVVRLPESDRARYTRR